MKTEKATFAAGCFWGVQDAFDRTKGVISTTAGYTGGHTKNPSYEDVCSDGTGHAEAVEIEFDPSNVSFEKLLALFFRIHDPTTMNRQGPDFGSQYRSAIFTHSPAQFKAARGAKEMLEYAKAFRSPIVTEIVEAVPFYPAEDYHQHYARTHPNAACHVKPATEE